MDSYLDLRDAIVRQAAEDYREAFMGNVVDKKMSDKTLWDCQKFFHSKWFNTLTNGGIDGDQMMQKLQVCEIERAINAYKAILDSKNTVTFHATVQFQRQFGENKRRSLKYFFPQALADDIIPVLKAQLQEMYKVLDVLKQQAENGSEPNEAQQQDVEVEK